jgi:hypothetical protein
MIDRNVVTLQLKKTFNKDHCNLNSGERIPCRLCRGVSEQPNKEVLDGIACPTVRRGFPANMRRGVQF